MPNPLWMGGEGDNPLDNPDRTIEILGRGSKSRKSKTYIRELEQAALLGHIRGYSPMLIELFRRLHAKKHTVTIVEEDDDGNTVKRTVPEILSDQEVRKVYWVTALWEEQHQEQVDHLASVGGFSIMAVSGMMDEMKDKARRESSAGADRSNEKKIGASDAVSNPRWR